ncbi:hypothetical protein ACTA71_002204 [Dictyostelium dimigraforme]
MKIFNLILILTLSWGMICFGESLKNSKTINVDPNRYSRIILDKDHSRIYFSLLDKVPMIASMEMKPDGNMKIESTLPSGYINLVWRNPVTGDFLVSDNSLKPDGHRSTRLFYPKTGILGKTISSSSLNTAYQNYFNVANAGSFTYDYTNGLIYMCSVYERGVFPLTSIMMDKSNNGFGETGTCEQVKKMNNAFYFLDFALNGTSSNIYSNATGSLYSHYATAPILVSDTTIKDFDLSSTHLYYSNSFKNKLYEIPLNGQNITASKREILNFMPDSFGYHNGYIYYSNGFSINRISITPYSKPEILKQ